MLSSEIMGFPASRCCSIRKFGFKEKLTQELILAKNIPIISFLSLRLHSIPGTSITACEM